MFRLNKLTDYAVVVMTHMARSPEPSLHTARELAGGTLLPAATVGKVLRTLLDHRLLTSHRGMNGGYALARPAREVSVAEVIDAAIALGGTITGEHGVGLAKRQFLAKEQSVAELSLQRRLKAAFDLDDLFNSGKILL